MDPFSIKINNNISATRAKKIKGSFIALENRPFHLSRTIDLVVDEM